MCGIIGYTGSENAVEKLISGLSALEYRGYDSAGISVFTEDSSLATIKSKGRLKNLEEKIQVFPQIKNCRCGIGHTRWATHGEPSDVNAHPHGTPLVSIVHNGIIENYSELKTFLINNGYSFESQTDTEAAVKLIDFYYRVTHDPVFALIQARKMLVGSYAVGAVFSNHPGVIYAFRKDSPLIAAKGKNENFIASDITAVLKYTNRYLQLEEGEIAVITDEYINVFSEKGTLVCKDFEIADWSVSDAEKAGFPHFMIKEIHDEPQALVQTVRPRIKDGLPFFGDDAPNDEMLISFEKIHIVACGTAMHAGLIGKFAVESLARTPVNVEIASEFRYKKPILNKNDLVIIISQSGETADTLAALRLAKSMGVYTLAVVNAVGSSISREADSVIYTWAGPEIAVASTKAYTVQLSIMYLFALRMAYARKTLTKKQVEEYVKELFERIPETLDSVLKNKELCRKIALKYKNNKSVFFIGRGSDYALSMEAALKLKEISYIHSEAYAAGELKHGTISLVTDGTPVFALANCRELYDKMMSNINEVRSRGASVILICGENAAVPDDIADDVLRVPQTSELFAPIPAASIMQLIAYYTALELGCDIDCPRNLAKSVTVE